ncbi:MAG: RHS repeat domain-containing protein [Pirellulaceae bacterium]
MYDPVVGQFISEDPTEFEALDPNLRRYVSNDPTNFTDPTGLEVYDSGKVYPPFIRDLEKRGVPNALAQWAQDFGMPLYKGNADGFQRNRFGRTWIEVGPAMQALLDALANGQTSPLVPSTVMQEMFHAWFNNVATWTTECEWLKKIMRAQTQFGKDTFEKSEEAMSELIDHLVFQLATGKRVPTYREIMEGKDKDNEMREWWRALRPGHNDKGEKWPDDPGADKPMSENLYYATIWVLFNLGKNPLPHRQKGPAPLRGLSDGDVPHHLKLFFMEQFRKNWKSNDGTAQ